MDFKKPLELFSSGEMVKICAPMVRYSKLPFRELVRCYGCDLAFTPMIISSSFNQSVKARNSEFRTNENDRPLIAQFAANNANDIATAAEIIYPYSDGVDINCGCPQRWALADGYGGCLLKKPDLLKDMVLQTRNRITDNEYTVSIKIRIHNDIRQTVELCRTAEHAGLSWLTVHGRTVQQRKEPVNLEAIKLIRENLSIPVVANGDIVDLESANRIQEFTGVKGVMAARGILENPALFVGAKRTSIDCIKKWIDIALSIGISFGLFHHHLMFMLEGLLPRSERRVFNTLSSTTAVLDYIRAWECQEDTD